MKISILFLISVAFTSQAFAKSKCMTNAIGIIHETEFGISFGGTSGGANFGESSLVNVPLSINNQPACFLKKSSFKMKNETKKDKADKNKITISPLEVEFENIPDANKKQYIFVEKQDNILLTKFHTMSFVCAGEIPLSIEATSDSVSKIILDSSTASMKTGHVFATGKAAENLHKARKEETSAQETFNFFNQMYMDKTQRELMADKPCCTEYRIPSIITDTSIKSLTGVERAIASSFTTMASKVPNGCSKDFAETMKNYQLENYTANESLKNYSVKKKWFSDDLTFEW